MTLEIYIASGYGVGWFCCMAMFCYALGTDDDESIGSDTFITAAILSIFWPVILLIYPLHLFYESGRARKERAKKKEEKQDDLMDKSEKVIQDIDDRWAKEELSCPSCESVDIEIQAHTGMATCRSCARQWDAV